MEGRCRGAYRAKAGQRLGYACKLPQGEWNVQRLDIADRYARRCSPGARYYRDAAMEPSAWAAPPGGGADRYYPFQRGRADACSAVAIMTSARQQRENGVSTPD